MCKVYQICEKCGHQQEIKPITNTERELWQKRTVQLNTTIKDISEAFIKYQESTGVDLFERRKEIVKLTRQLEQREDFIRDIFGELKNSNSKSTLVNVLLSRCEAQINSQMLGVI